MDINKGGGLTLVHQPFGRFCGTPPRRYSAYQENNHYLRAMP